MNIYDYPKLKATGRANMMKVNQSYAIGIQRMNPDGTNGDFEQAAIGREDVDKFRSALEVQIAALDAITAEMDELDK